MRGLARLTLLVALLGSATGCHRTAPTAASDTVEGIARFEQRVAVDPRDALSPTTLAGLYVRAFDETGDRTALRHAATAARVALARQPDYAPAQVALARALFADDQVDEARALTDEVLERDPVDIAAMGVAFDLALASGATARAAMWAERLLSRDESPETIDRLGRLASHRGDSARAIALWQRAAADAEELGARPVEIAKYRARALAR